MVTNGKIHTFIHGHWFLHSSFSVDCCTLWGFILLGELVSGSLLRVGVLDSEKEVKNFFIFF